MCVCVCVYIERERDAYIYNLACRVYSQETEGRSWLQDTVKRKLVDFALNRRFFYLPGACSPFFGSTRLKVSINLIFISGALVFYQSSG